jgi:hypothetical protein
MDDHYDGKVSDDEFMQAAASAWDSVALSAAHDPDLTIAVRVLEEFLAGARTGMLLRPLYGDLRIALVDLEEFRSALYSDLAVTSREGRCTCPRDAETAAMRVGAQRDTGWIPAPYPVFRPEVPCRPASGAVSEQPVSVRKKSVMLNRGCRR